MLIVDGYLVAAGLELFGIPIESAAITATRVTPRPGSITCVGSPRIGSFKPFLIVWSPTA